MSQLPAIILARAGSKGVPRKNIALVCGRPCIAWTIEAAQKAARVSRVVVTTDDSDAARIARGMGANVVNRPPSLATDTARVDDVARHAVLEIEGGRKERGVVILYANVPVRPEGLIDRAVELLIQSNCDSVQSYASVGKHHPWWTTRVDELGRVTPWEGEVLNHGVYRRQALPTAFIPDGGVLVVSRAALFGEVSGVAQGPHAFFGNDRRAVVNAEGAVVDIDTRADLAMADALLTAEMREKAELASQLGAA